MQDLILISKTGKEYYIIHSITPIKSDRGQMKGFVLVIKDMTSEYKLRQQVAQSQKMDTLGQLAGGIAHDFNNVLSGIMGAANLLQMKLKEDTQEMKLARMITETSEKASELTGQLLTFSRKQVNQAEPVDLHDVIGTSAKLLERTIDKRITIKTELSAENSTVKGYYFILQNMIINLGINAGHAMPKGGILTITTKNVLLDISYCHESSSDLEPGEYISLTVEDTGTGIPAAVLPRIFEPFFTTKEQGRGTGLGLASVYGGVSQHKGEINVCSEMGEGTSFIISIPLTKNPGETVGEETSPVHEGEGTILVIDDEELIRITTKQMLETMGYHVLTAENGKMGFESFQKNEKTIDLIVLDFIMPEMNGLDCLKKIRGINKNVPVILISGFAKPRQLEEIEKIGISGQLTKPFQKRDLITLLNRLYHN